MNQKPNWVKRAMSGNFQSPFSYTYPSSVKERELTKCYVNVPGGYKQPTKK